MKRLNVVVNDAEDIIYYKDRPYHLENMSFVRDETHNCQMVIYATMKPLVEKLNTDTVLLKSAVDDMIEQLEYGNPCDVCGDELPSCDCVKSGDSLYG